MCSLISLRLLPVLYSTVTHAPLIHEWFNANMVKSSLHTGRCWDLYDFGSLFILEIVNYDHVLYFSTGDVLHSVHEWAVVTSDFFQAVVSGYLCSICSYLVRKISQNQTC